MTTDKRRKARIRARMTRTGERYTTARRHLVDSPPPQQLDLGYTLRGGQQPDAAALRAVLAHHGVTMPDGRPISEALLFGIAGGLGAGYILWEFAAHGSRVVVLGFSNQWQYIGRDLRAALERLGIPAAVHTTGGAATATRHLEARVDGGRPVITWPDHQIIGHWYLPAHLDGHGGHPVVVYGRHDGRFHIDDRALAPLTVPEADLHRARARTGTYKHLLVDVEATPGALDAARLRGAVVAGIDACVAQLSGTSASFALPAWRKWARMMTDRRNAKGWPRVFADGGGLVGALLSVWEATSDSGMTGGPLRDLYCDFLDEAASLLDADFDSAIAALRSSARQWRLLGDVAVDPQEPDLARLRELTVTARAAIAADGDAGRDEAAAAAADLWRRRTALNAAAPLPAEHREAVFARMGEVLASIHELETSAVAHLAGAVDEVR